MFKTSIIVAAALLAAHTVAADEYTVFGKSDPWTVFSNKASGGCFLQDIDNNGNLVRMGIRSTEDAFAYLAVWNTSANILDPGETAEVALEVNGETFTFTANANVDPVSQGYSGAFMFLDKYPFILALESADMIMVNGLGGAFSIDLAGSHEAAKMARECFALNH